MSEPLYERDVTYVFTSTRGRSELSGRECRVVTIWRATIGPPSYEVMFLHNNACRVVLESELKPKRQCAQPAPAQVNQ
jgi:hypothetical protein